MRPKGFTLIELVIGIVVLAVALTFLTTTLLPLASRSVDPLLEMKATELASALFSELRSKRFDENSDPDGGQSRCGESGIICTDESNFGAEPGENNRADFDDIDDYHSLELKGDAISDISGSALTGRYSDYKVEFDVSYQGVLLGLDNDRAKQVVITITLPKKGTLQFSTFRVNY